jgi:hypothetical protein
VGLDAAGSSAPGPGVRRQVPAPFARLFADRYCGAGAGYWRQSGGISPVQYVPAPPECARCRFALPVLSHESAAPGRRRILVSGDRLIPAQQQGVFRRDFRNGPSRRLPGGYFHGAAMRPGERQLLHRIGRQAAVRPRTERAGRPARSAGRSVTGLRLLAEPLRRRSVSGPEIDSPQRPASTGCRRLHRRNSAAWASTRRSGWRTRNILT